MVSIRNLVGDFPVSYDNQTDLRSQLDIERQLEQTEQTAIRCQDCKNMTLGIFKIGVMSILFGLVTAVVLCGVMGGIFIFIYSYR